MDSYKVEAIGFMCMAVFACLQGVMALIKPQWTIGRTEWYRVRKDMEKQYKKRFLQAQLFYAAAFFIGGVLCYLKVHIIVIILVMLLGSILQTRWYPRKDMYFYDCSHRK